MTASQTHQYILLPARGVHLALPPSGIGHVGPPGPIQSGARASRHGEAPTVEVRVLDTIRDDGPALIEVSAQTALALRAYEPAVRLIPVVYYAAAVAPRPMPTAPPVTAGSRVAVTIALRVLSRGDGRPVAGATVIAFTDFVRRIGVQAETNANGDAYLALGAASARLERLYVYPRSGFWGALRHDATVATGTEIDLEPLDLGYVDALRHFYGHAPDEAGRDVRVGVIDTGVAAHPDLEIEGGENTVTGEDARDHGDNGEGHGTHVAGIITARGRPPVGLRGLAPAVALRSYRVFAHGSPFASNFAIAKAIDRAVADGCDLINLSLGGPAPDPATSLAIEDARDAGSLVIVAAGNDGHGPVNHPAADAFAVAVTAMGRLGTFPDDSTEASAVAPLFGADPDNFVAAFSNVGPEIDLIAPGVGILSTVPGGYAAQDGTSMACPAVTGMAARLLAARDDIRAMTRGRSRSDALAALVLHAARPLGFGAAFEGRGQM